MMMTMMMMTIMMRITMLLVTRLLMMMILTVLRIMTKMSVNDNVLHFMVISFSFLTLMA